jgi:hypothetical protein
MSNCDYRLNPNIHCNEGPFVLHSYRDILISQTCYFEAKDLSAIIAVLRSLFGLDCGW